MFSLYTSTLLGESIFRAFTDIVGLSHSFSLVGPPSSLESSPFGPASRHRVHLSVNDAHIVGSLRLRRSVTFVAEMFLLNFYQKLSTDTFSVFLRVRSRMIDVPILVKTVATDIGSGRATGMLGRCESFFGTFL